MDDVLENVELVFKHHGRGQVFMPPKSSMDLRSVGIDGGTGIMPAYVGPLDASGVKLVSGYDGNPARGLPYIVSMIVLQDPSTGFPLAIMDGSLITGMRTGAAVGISAKYFGTENLESAAFIGAGVQARFALQAVCQLCDPHEVRVFDVVPERAHDLVNISLHGSRPSFKVADTIEEAVTGAQLVVTATTSNEPLVQGRWLAPGSTAVSIGSFQEFDDDAVLQADKIVVDSWEQCAVRGELKRFVEAGTLDRERIFAEIGDVVATDRSGRDSDSERVFITPMGIGSHDISIAKLVYDRVLESDAGTSFDFF